MNPTPVFDALAAEHPHLFPHHPARPRPTAAASPPAPPRPATTPRHPYTTAPAVADHDPDTAETPAAPPATNPWFTRTESSPA
ncbi:hypothetical protein SAMN05421505_120125 [Sinosporangium album]|uniref:Uncharacterized protein n=1 Tax=Sinosporangium album TaxID=504805 RepID=A0A1G8EJI4_9ACTN|nr:hypothetical protein [Sinosporangium album]SDH69962.1 hypothetical protein SAMN05421505_120125 [Sinosporangium album]